MGEKMSQIFEQPSEGEILATVEEGGYFFPFYIAEPHVTIPGLIHILNTEDYEEREMENYFKEKYLAINLGEYTINEFTYHSFRFPDGREWDAVNKWRG